MKIRSFKKFSPQKNKCGQMIEDLEGCLLANRLLELNTFLEDTSCFSLKNLPFLVFLIVSFFISGCFGPSGYSLDEKRKNVLAMRTKTLNRLYKVHPEARGAVKKAKGYGVFSNVGTNLFLLSTASGWGIVRNNQSGKGTYMNMFSAGIGPGLGIKDFRGVFVFTSKKALNNFVQKGWTAQGQADAAAKAGKKGGSVSGAIEVAPGIKLFQITENGLALQATIQGTKFWKDSELN